MHALGPAQLLDRDSHPRDDQAATALAARTASTTSACCARLERREHRKREPVTRRALGHGQRALAVAEVREDRLQVQRVPVVHGGTDAALAKRSDQLVATRRAHDEQVVDVRRARRRVRQIDGLAESELGVAGRNLGALAVPAVDERCELEQHRGLQLVEPRVEADLLEHDLVLRAVEAQDARALLDACVGGRDQAAVAERGQVLGREERERRRVAERAAARARQATRRTPGRRPPPGTARACRRSLAAPERPRGARTGAPASSARVRGADGGRGGLGIEAERVRRARPRRPARRPPGRSPRQSRRRCRPGR